MYLINGPIEYKILYYYILNMNEYLLEKLKEASKENYTVESDKALYGEIQYNGMDSIINFVLNKISEDEIEKTLFVDIGCGRGLFNTYFLLKYPKLKKSIGVDYDSSLIRQGRIIIDNIIPEIMKDKIQLMKMDIVDLGDKINFDDYDHVVFYTFNKVFDKESNNVLFNYIKQVDESNNFKSLFFFSSHGKMVKNPVQNSTLLPKIIKFYFGLKTPFDDPNPNRIVVYKDLNFLYENDKLQNENGVIPLEEIVQLPKNLQQIELEYLDLYYKTSNNNNNNNNNINYCYQCKSTEFKKEHSKQLTINKQIKLCNIKCIKEFEKLTIQ